jgi:AhpD family alkylhydroperoxidase
MFLSKSLDELYRKFADAAYVPGRLDAKTKELMALACSVMVDCTPCIEWHHRKAVEHGASEDEVAETLAITMTVSAGSKPAKYGALMDELRAKLRR